MISKPGAIYQTCQRLIAIGCCLLLCHCARVPVAPEEPVEWQAHKAAVGQLDHWVLQAKLGIRAPDESGSARLSWDQTGESYRIQLTGPLGQGTLRLTGTARGVTLEQSGEPPKQAASAEQLLWETTGWELPVAPLATWVRGIPAPDAPVELMQFDEHHLLAELHQLDWILSYSRYGNYQGVFLPGRIIAERGEVRLTLVIHQWQLGPDGE